MTKFKGYTALIRDDDVTIDIIDRMKTIGVHVEIKDIDSIVAMFHAMGNTSSPEAIWPKGNVYLIPPR